MSAKSLPFVGLGTMEFLDGSAEVEALYETTLAALKCGYRHLDCAELYETGLHVGRAITDSKVNRGELFISSKLKGLPSGDYAAVKERVQKICTVLQVESLDLLMVHWPGSKEVDLSLDTSSIAAACEWGFFQSNIASAWKNMLQLRQDGLCAQVGVSNFYPAHLAELRKHAAAPGDMPFANQIYLDACHQEVDFVQAMQAEGIRVIGYRPLAFMAMYGFMGDAVTSVLEAKAAEVGASSSAQLILAALIKAGVHVVAKSKAPEHLAENLAAEALAAKVPAGFLKELDGNEMVAMMGAADEAAAAFKQVAEGQQ